MRTFLTFTAIAICLYFHFNKKEEKVTAVKEDTLSTHLSALDKKSMVSSQLMAEEDASQALVQPSSSDEQDESLYQDDSNSNENVDDEMAQLPWEEIEEGWRTQLRDYLVSVAPDQAEEMFSAYLEEKRKFVDRVDESSENGVSEEGHEQGGDREPATKGLDLEAVHEENLHEIFGEHFSQIKSLHTEYVESVQYLNRSSVRFTIPL